MKAQFPDRPYLKRVVKRLWQGRAAAFVGAGVSRSAVRRAPGADEFPLWPDLAEAMSGELYGEEQSPTDYDPLRLAQEYETAFGRDALSELVAREVPNREYDPGPLHVKLLNLPWTDVLTTNYDTLLERACRKAERKYEVVRRPEDLSRRHAPRIVKLHGSLPSDYPFVITEEDYRTYPQRLAPFVSLARTSLMEHAFVLLGFSGEDPNFLRWSGWIRDNLEENAPPIYLCGALDLSAPKRKQLESYGVRPIDLAPLFADWPDPDRRHAAALRWFLEALRCNEPEDPIEWPEYRSARNREPDVPASYPSVPSPSLPPPEPSSIKTGPHKAGESANRRPEKVLEPWQEARKDYPGWIVAPRGIRNRLWRGTQSWGRNIVRSIEDVDPPDDLALLYELAWRRRLCLLPLDGKEVQAAKQVLERYNPAPHKLDLSAATITPNEPQHKRLDWSYLTKAWVELSIFLLREARAHLDEASFEKHAERARPLADAQGKWTAAIGYETALLHLARLDEDNVRQSLNDWPSTMRRFPFGEVRRAAIWIELDDKKETVRLAERALSRILEAQSAATGPHFALWSQEGWARRLLRIARSEEDRAALFEPARWKEKLRPHRCDPFETYRTVAVRLDKKVPPPQSQQQTKRKFEPGVRSHSFSLLYSPYEFSEHRPGFECIQMMEAGAWPPWLGYGVKPPETAQKAVDWTRPFEPLMALSVAFRLGTEETADFFSRMRVASLSGDQVEHLYEWLLRGVRQRVKHLDSRELRGMRHPEAQRLSTLLEVLSRISVRVSPSRCVEVAELGFRICGEPVVQKDFSFYEALGALFRRTLRYLNSEQTQEILESALSFPAPSGEDPLVEKWPKPVLSLQDVELSDSFSTDHAATIEKLCESVASSDARERDGGIWRLGYLYKNGGLTASQEQSFAEALWGDTEEETGLPKMTHAPKSYLLALPEVDEEQAVEHLRKLLIEETPRSVSKKEVDGEVKRAISPAGLSAGRAANLIAATVPRFRSAPNSERRYIDWTEGEIKKLLDEVAALWDEDGQSLREEQQRKEGAPPYRSFGSHSIKSGLQDIPSVMRKVILPRLSAGSKSVGKVKDILEGMTEVGFTTVAAWPSLLRLEAVGIEEAELSIQDGLNASSLESIEKATEAVYDWHLMRAADQVPAPPEELLNELVYAVSARREMALSQTLNILARLVENVPDVLGENQLQKLINGLSRLAEETASLDPEKALSRPRLPEEFLDAPEQRAASARLACALKKSRADSLGEAGSKVLSEWEAICERDPLPEVRQAWTKK